ncbi:hypothetical protein HW555_014340 [Spodoptera exigua]|uniref:Adenine phosphoribosyltransferase n=1 Tax=Spodoptera exigua TaxID=7107 RepID=A0A835G2W9_SPOEX|nr:hypothetical protein HW555_014340 [Spodoptera exigua]
MYDMEKVVTRIQEAIANGEKILVYGDYDADGITSTTVMKEAIELIGGEVDYFLPNRFIQGLSFGDLAGVGVAFKVAVALLGELPVEFLDLVAIGTIADLVSLTDENRVLVKMGLEMIQTAELKKESVSEENIAFTIGPRLNALGRLGDASPGVELMTTFDEEEAERIANYINTQNDERKEIVATITKEAFDLIKASDPIHIIAKQGWHEGVLGIVAGRIMQDTGKPTIVLTIDENNEFAKGSGRSVSALNLFEALSEIREDFTHFGGHHMAAGMTLPVENIEKIKVHLVDYLEKNQIDLSQGQELQLDESLSVSEVTLPFIQQLKILAPFGTDNPVPNFLFEDVTIEQCRQIGADKSHLKFQLAQSGAILDAIAFQMGNQADEMGQGTTSVCGQLSINEWNGNKKPQLMVNDFSVEGVQLFDLRGKNARQKEIPTSNTLYIYFHPDSLKLIEDQRDNKLLFKDVNETVSMIEAANVQQVVFVDCPEDVDVLREITQKGKIERIFMMVISQDEAYLNGAGTREQFAQLYKFVRQQEQVDVRYKLNIVAQHLKIQEKLLIFMIQVIPDYPEKGIVFRDISPLMANGDAYREATKQIVDYAKEKRIDMVVGPEARGFIVGCPVAYELGVGFAPVRKKGKLPRETIEVTYDLEYGTDTLTLHKDAIQPGQRVLICDDLLATGGTIKATIELIESLGGIVVGCAFLIELMDLHGRDKIKGYEIVTLMEY